MLPSSIGHFGFPSKVVTSYNNTFPATQFLLSVLYYFRTLTNKVSNTKIFLKKVVYENCFHELARYLHFFSMDVSILQWM